MERKIRIGLDYLSAHKNHLFRCLYSRMIGSGSYNARSEIRRKLGNGRGPASYEFLRLGKRFSICTVRYRFARCRMIQTASRAVIKERNKIARFPVILLSLGRRRHRRDALIMGMHRGILFLITREFVSSVSCSIRVLRQCWPRG